jgi:2-polyprenyl-3-methyl-5-hydroxy-6-metoxy-1,4-benzoquinol methylase
MTKKYPTKNPDKYMEGWDNLYKKQIDENLENLQPHFVHYAPLEFSFFTYEQDTAGKTALDLATGDGIDACYLAQLGYQVTALDILQSAVDLTKRRAKSLNIEDKVEVLCETIENFELEPECYDVVSAIQCLQYLYENALSKLYELLNSVKPGGFFLFGGNVKPHFKTDPPIRFITMTEIKQALKGWKLFSIAKEVRLVSPNDRRGYIWVVAQKPQKK